MEQTSQQSGVRPHSPRPWRSSVAAPDNQRADKDPTTGRFLPGNSGFTGRPRGSRNKLMGEFLDDLRATWATHGKVALERCAVEEPGRFVQIVSNLLPREAKLNIQETSIFCDVSDYARAFEMCVGILKSDPPELP